MVQDRWGSNWQFSPRVLMDAMPPDGAEAKRACEAMMEMGAIDIAKIEPSVTRRLRSSVASRRSRASKGWGEISPAEFKQFIGKDMRVSQVEYAPKGDSQQILSFYMGKNTPERKDYIMENLVVPVED